MDETEAMTAMKAGLKDVDKLLDKVARNVMQVNNNKLVSESELQSFASSLRNECDAEGIRKKVSSILQNHYKDRDLSTDIYRLEIPLSLLGLKEPQLLQIQSSDVIEDTLISHNVDITIHQFDEICSEIPHVDYGYLKKDDVVSDEDVGVIDSKDLSFLKSKDKMKWEKVTSNLEFQSLTQQIYQIIAGLDLQLTVDDIYELAKQAICIALAWKQSCDVGKASNVALHKLFMKNDRGTYIFKEVQHCGNNSTDITKIRCHFGTQPFGDDHYGIGMFIEMDTRLEVLWNPTIEQAADEGDADTNDELQENDAELVTSLICCLQQGFPLTKAESEKGLLFFDSVTNQDHYFYGHNTSAFRDIELSKLSLVFEDDISFHMSEITEQLTTTKLGDITMSMDSDESNEKQENLFGTEVFAWGDNACNCLGVEKNELEFIVNEPSVISFSSFSSFEPVDSIACSSCHTMILTKFGTVYSCGDGSDGQLGHNSLESLSNFQLVDFFNNRGDNRIIITGISVGSDDTSSHSAAIDSEYNLYTWGKSIICGHPRTDKSPESSIKVPKLVRAFENEQVLQISCGGGFTLVRTLERSNSDESNTSTVYSWGKTERGRLGIGKLKPLRKAPMPQDAQEQIPWCQCYPTVLKSLEGEEIVDISAGSKHALAVNTKGKVFAWGSNSSGECCAVNIRQSLSTKITRCKTPHQSVWDDLWIPREVSFFGNNITKVMAKNVSAGGIQSAAIDSNGLVYTWGGGGHVDCLGHGDISEYEYGISEKMDASRRQFQAMSGHLEAPQWATPRVLDSLKNYRAVKVDLGAKHGAVVTDSGCIFSWGNEASSEPSMGTSLSTPSHPSDKQLQILQGKQVVNVACGYDRTFCITSGSAFGRSVGTYLLRQCELFLRALAIEDDDIVVRNPSLIDCAIIVGGRRMYCHKVILASRSDLLKKMILDEERSSKQITEIFIPGIQFSTMKHIVDFFYTDTIDFAKLSSFESVLNLQNGALMLKLNSLKAICQQILSKVYECDHANNHSINETDEHTTGGYLPVDLSRYLLRQEDEFADVHVIAANDGSISYAHKCILRCGSDYFRGILDELEVEPTSHQLQNRTRNITTMKLPGNRTNVLRLLYYLYSGVVPTTSEFKENNQQTCETNISREIETDLINAEEFKLPLMKAQSESSILITPENSLNVLQLSYEVNSSKLKLNSLNMICKILKQCGVDKEEHCDSDFNFNSWKEELGFTLSNCPGYAEELFEMITVMNTNTTMPKDRKKVATQSLEVTKKQKEKARKRMIDDISDSDMMDRSFLLKMVMIFVFLSGHLILESIIVFHPLVTMTVNVTFLIVTAIFLLQRL